jgi:hypothetical protein
MTWAGDVVDHNPSAQIKDQQLNLKHCSVSGNIPSALKTDSDLSKGL